LHHREGLVRSNQYYQPKGESAENLKFMVIIDKQFLNTPWYGSRQPLGTLLRNTLPVSEWRVICSGKATSAAATGSVD
jgi:putative transposase